MVEEMELVFLATQYRIESAQFPWYKKSTLSFDDTRNSWEEVGFSSPRHKYTTLIQPNTTNTTSQFQHYKKK